MDELQAFLLQKLGELAVEQLQELWELGIGTGLWSPDDHLRYLELADDARRAKHEAV